ncbi:hypothetical protein BN1095_6480001 [Clostridioides difficile]|uniref:Uncharacterized protein n=1 Tax=Clostridioides difficile TaxID=1496 RepID=A0A069AU54_CLODI|nr:hypothetical protein BN1095_6480001 [Clostridioides difficile]
MAAGIDAVGNAAGVEGTGCVCHCLQNETFGRRQPQNGFVSRAGRRVRLRDAGHCRAA